MGPDPQDRVHDDEDDSADLSDIWEEGEEEGDERLPFDPADEDAGESKPEPEPDQEEFQQEDEASTSSPWPSPPEYPPAPCFVTVSQGDCILSLAKRYRRLPKQIADAPENTELLKNRARNVLLPGDQVYIPAVEVKEFSGATEARYRFKLCGGICVLKLKLLWNGKARANLDYVLTVEKRTYEGATDGDGMLNVKIPADAQRGTLRLRDRAGEEVYDLNLGHLNPLEHTTGVQARLNNLGYACGSVDGEVGPMTQAAIAAFQRDQGLEITGRLDEATRSRLLELHGS